MALLVPEGSDTGSYIVEDLGTDFHSLCCVSYNRLPMVLRGTNQAAEYPASTAQDQRVTRQIHTRCRQPQHPSVASAHLSGLSWTDLDPRTPGNEVTNPCALGLEDWAQLAAHPLKLINRHTNQVDDPKMDSHAHVADRISSWAS